MIDTSLMVNDYPEPSEPKLKCFKFDFKASINGFGIIYAEDIEKAKEGAINGEYDDIIDTYDMKIEEITEIEEN